MAIDDLIKKKGFFKKIFSPIKKILPTKTSRKVVLYTSLALMYLGISGGGCGSKTATKPVIPNVAPTLDYIADMDFDEGQTGVLIASGTDVDNGPVTPPTFSTDNANFVQIVPGRFEWPAGNNDAGVYIVRVSMFDGQDTDSQNVQVTINDVPPPNTPPVLDPVSDSEIDENNELVKILTGSDFDLDPLTFKITPLGYFTETTPGTFKWTPPYPTTDDPSEDFFFIAEVSDGKDTDTQGFKVKVNDSKLLYKRVLSGFGDLIVKNPDGSGIEQKITDTPNINETNGVWSPDGEKILYLSDEPGYNEVYVFDVRTGVKTRLTFTPAAKKNPKWDPNMAFVYFEDSDEIKKVDFPSGANEVNLSNSFARDGFYEISDDALEMLFATSRYNGGTLQIAKMDLTTYIVTRLTTAVGEEEWRPTYHPLFPHTKFAFQTTRVAGRQLYEGTLPTGLPVNNVSQDAAFNEFPKYTLPNGTFLIYKWGNNIRRVNSGGGGKIDVTTSNDVIGKVLCIPNAIVYSKDLGAGILALFKANTDGTNEIQLTASNNDSNPNHK